MSTNNSFLKIFIFLIFIFILEYPLAYTRVIELNYYGVNINTTAIYNVKRNSNFIIKISYDSGFRIKLDCKKKKISYTAVNWNGSANVVNNLTANNRNTTMMTFQMTSDAMEFSLKLDNGTDSSNFHFTVFAKNYMALIPTGGLAMMKFDDQYNYYYAAEERRPNSVFHGDSSYIFNLCNKHQNWSSNVYLGANYNYIATDVFSFGLSTAFGYNIGATTTPINSMIGLNIAIGRKIKFVAGGGFAFMKIKTIPDNLLDQKIYAKFSSPPTVPSGYEIWMRGYYINFGVTVMSLTD